MNKVLLLTTEPLPYEGRETTGAGLRAWGLMQGLRSSGLEVLAATPEDALKFEISSIEQKQGYRSFNREYMQELVDDVSPDVLLFQHWGLFRHLRDARCPIAMDLAGPHLLERYYWSRKRDDSETFLKSHESDFTEKLHALRNVDFVTCSGNYQRHYFLPFLYLAGFAMVKDICPVIPFSMDPEPPPEYGDQRNHELFVYGGIFLPWQNPEQFIRLLLETFERERKGQLNFYGGTHPAGDISGGRFDRLSEMLNRHPRVETRGIIPWNELRAEYCRAGIALDIMERNPERELAFTTRTVVYLWCGLPVLYNDYSELSELIREFDAGWTFSQDDSERFIKTVRRILRGEENLEEKRKNGQRLIKQRLNWHETITPLAKFCRDPYQRDNKTETVTAIEGGIQKIDKLEEDLARANSELDRLKGKLWFRIYENLSCMKWAVALVIFIFTLPLSFLIFIIIMASKPFHGGKR